MSGLSGVAALAAGEKHSLGLLSNGTVMAWGANESGQLGDGTTENSDLPVAVSGLSEVTAISAGSEDSLALLRNGTVMAWGGNPYGQLGVGDGTTTSRDVPVAVRGLSGVTAIAAGGYMNAALLNNGTVMAWGGEGEGMLGNGEERSEVPIVVKGLTGVNAISLGDDYGLALLSNGTVMAWGRGAEGELGISPIPSPFPWVARPVPVSGLNGVTAIHAAKQHALALLENGTVVAWGSNRNGALGVGTYEGPETCEGSPCSMTPIAVGGLSGVTAISGGGNGGTGDFSEAVLGDGTVMAWGGGDHGQLGTGAPTEGAGKMIESDVPVAVSGLSGVALLAGGGLHSLAFSPPPPTVTGVRPNAGLEAGGTSVTLNGTSFTSATAVEFGSVPGTHVTVSSPTALTVIAPSGIGTVNVTVTTVAGTSVTSAADQFSYVRPAPPPTITKLSAHRGAAAGGKTVTITGTNFTGATAVKFGSIAATSYKVTSPTAITAVSPAEASKTVDVTVTTRNGISAISSADDFKFGPPTVTHVSPDTGSKNGGAAVTITGTGFGLGSEATLFKFGSTEATTVNCTAITTCTVIAPSHAVGMVDVKATVTGQSSPKATGDQFTYN